MSAPKSAVSDHPDQDEVTPVVPDEPEPDTKPCTAKNSATSSSSASSVGNTREPRHTYKAAFFNFVRDLKRIYKNRDYQSIMSLGSRKWRTMSQAQKAPYVLEAAKNRKLERDHHRRSTKSKKGEKRKSRQESPVPNKKSKTENSPPETSNSGHCATCGKRRKGSPKPRQPSAGSNASRHSSVSSKSSRSSKSSKSNKSR